jgi:hypothetical protein
MKMEELCFSEMLADLYWTYSLTSQKITFHVHQCENLNFFSVYSIYEVEFLASAVLRIPGCVEISHL